MSSTEGNLYTRPNADTRRHCGIGLVAPTSSTGSNSPSVYFTNAQGAPNSFGVQVLVQMVPAGDILPCRVGSACAGDGMGEYHPFIEGDEVVVLIPDGDEKNGGIIIGRLNQEADVFPTTVGGADVTQNSIAFKRVLAPYILESGTSIIVRNAATGGALTLDPTGNTYLSDGNGNGLVMRSDVVSLALKDTAAGIQLNPDTDDLTLIAQSGDCSLLLDSTASQFQSKGTLQFSTLGNYGVNHVMTTEALGAILNALVTAIAAVATGPVTGAALAAAFAVPGAMGTMMAGALSTPLDQLSSQAVAAALVTPKSPGAPGIGSQGVQVD